MAPTALGEKLKYDYNKSVPVSITTRTREKVARVIQPHALGRGLTVAQVRDLYPAGAVRRTSVLEALSDLEAMGRVEWHGDRVRWVGPLEVDHVFGEPVRRIERDREATPEMRGSTAAMTSNAIVRRSAS